MSDMKDRVMQVILAEANVKKGFIPDHAKNKFSDNSGNLKCPFCQQELVRHWGMKEPALYCCDNPKCSRGGVATESAWQELIRTRKALDVAVDLLKIMHDGLPNGNRWKWEIEKTLEQITALEKSELENLEMLVNNVFK